MPELATLITDGPLLYLVVAALVMGDAVFPMLPSETLLVTGGVLAARGDVAVIPLVVAGAVGALAGHLLLYAIGAAAGSRLLERLARSGPGRDRILRVGEQLDSRPWLLIVADFIPWGRTVVMSGAGATGLAFRHFLTFASIGAVLWASFFASLGAIGGTVFDSSWHSLAASLGVVFVIGLVMEAINRRSEGARSRRGRVTAKRLEDIPLHCCEPGTDPLC